MRKSEISITISAVIIILLSLCISASAQGEVNKNVGELGLLTKVEIDGITSGEDRTAAAFANWEKIYNAMVEINGTGGTLTFPSGEYYAAGGNGFLNIQGMSNLNIVFEDGAYIKEAAPRAIWLYDSHNITIHNYKAVSTDGIEMHGSNTNIRFSGTTVLENSQAIFWGDYSENPPVRPTESGGSIKDSDGQSTVANVQYLQNTNDIVFDNLVMDGRQLTIKNQNGLRIKKFNSKNSNGYGIWVSWSKNISIDNAVIERGTAVATVEITNVMDCYFGDIEITKPQSDTNPDSECLFYLAADNRNQHIPPGELAAMDSHRIRLGKIINKSGRLEIARTCGLRAELLQSDNAARHGVYIESVKDFVINKAVVSKPNRGAGGGLIRGIYIGAAFNVFVLDTEIYYDGRVQPNGDFYFIGIGGCGEEWSDGEGEHHLISNNIYFENVELTSQIASTAWTENKVNLLELQGGDYAPQNVQVYGDYICLGDTSPKWRSLSMAPYPGKELSVTISNVTDSSDEFENKYTVDFAIENKKKTVSNSIADVIIAGYSEDGKLIGLNILSSHEILLLPFSAQNIDMSRTLIVDNEAEELDKVKAFVWGALEGLQNEADFDMYSLDV